MNEKRFAPQYLKVKTIDRENFTIRFVFSSNVVDRHGESIDQKGWKLDNYLKNPVVLWGHDQSLKPIGKAANMAVVGDTLEGDVIFAYKQNPDAAMTFELCAEGFLGAGSVGFSNLKWMYDEEKDLLTLLENELYEFSIVNVPANPEALIKGIEGMKAKNVDKKVIDNIIKFQEAAKKKAEDRFKNLGEEVKKDGADMDDDGAEHEPDPEDLDEIEKDPVEVEGADGATTTEETEEEKNARLAKEGEPSDEEVKSALEVLFKSKREIIMASVKELQSRLNDAHEDKQENAVDVTPANQGLQKGLSNRKINSLVRSLLNSKA